MTAYPARWATMQINCKQCEEGGGSEKEGERVGWGLTREAKTEQSS